MLLIDVILVLPIRYAVCPPVYALQEESFLLHPRHLIFVFLIL
jgi:hypothetical protein